MAEIVHELTVQAAPEQVFAAVATAQGMNCWWTLTASGEPEPGAVFALGFGPRFDWRGTVTRCILGAEFELRISEADSDWTGTHVTYELSPAPRSGTRIRFSHTGWPVQNQHWRISCYCWALYLRLLRRYLENGEVVPYAQRLDA